MSNFRNKPRKSNRIASVIVGVLVVIMLVGMLSMQAIQTLAIVRRGDDDRAKIMQAKELSEFAKTVDWNNAESQSLTMQIPDSVNLIGTPGSQAAILERQNFEDNPKTAKIIVRFPAEKPGEFSTTWELVHE